MPPDEQLSYLLGVRINPKPKPQALDTETLNPKPQTLRPYVNLKRQTLSQHFMFIKTEGPGVGPEKAYGGFLQTTHVPNAVLQLIMV